MNGEHTKPVEARSEKTEIYRVWFDDPNGQRRYVDLPRYKGISSIREGFWVTDDWEIVTGLVPLGGNWIPPHRVVIATKLDLEIDHG